MERWHPRLADFPELVNEFHRSIDSKLQGKVGEAPKEEERDEEEDEEEDEEQGKEGFEKTIDKRNMVPIFFF